MRQEGWYWLIDGIDESTLTYYYQNPDTIKWGFGFNIRDGGGFLPEDDLTDETKVVKAEIKIL